MEYCAQLLAGQQALVTGAGKGIGRACAAKLSDCGARVIAVARTKSDVFRLAQAHDRITPWVMDATSSAFLDQIEQGG